MIINQLEIFYQNHQQKKGYKTEIVPTTYMVQTLNKKWIFPLMISSFFVQWAPLFRLMVLFELLSSWSWWDWPLPLSEVLISLLKYLYLNFSSIEFENELKKHVRNVAEIKYEFVKLAVIFLLFLILIIKSRNSRPEVFCKNGAPRSFTEFTEKHLCQSLFFNKNAGLQIYLKRDSGIVVFLCILWNF